MKVLKLKIIFLILFLSFQSILHAQEKFTFPDIANYLTLTSDLHIHTVFSDGRVWPTIRVIEASREGIDIISITDHIEYRPFKEHVIGDHNQSYEVAKPQAERNKVILIKGTEITRDMPPGHSNAIFLTDIDALDTKEYKDSYKAAREQGAFIFWNHPCWPRQQPDTIVWFDEHTWLMENDMIHGLEVVNGKYYCPEAHLWCLEKNLTFIGTSDIHNPIGMDYKFCKGERRSITLIFAKERTEEAIKEALFDKRTVIFANNTFYGFEHWMKLLADASIRITSVERMKAQKYSVSIENISNAPFVLEFDTTNSKVLLSSQTIELNKGITTFTVELIETQALRGIMLPLTISNMHVRPNEGMSYQLNIPLTK